MRVKGKQCGSNSKGRGNAKLGGASGASLATVANPNSLTGAYRFRMLHRVERSLCAVRAQSYQITERESDVSRTPGRSRVPRAVFFCQKSFPPPSACYRNQDFVCYRKSCNRQNLGFCNRTEQCRSRSVDPRRCRTEEVLSRRGVVCRSEECRYRSTGMSTIFCVVIACRSVGVLVTAWTK